MSEESGSIEHLRRIAFGPDSSAQERAAAEKSLHELEMAERAALSESVDDVPVEDGAAASDDFDVKQFGEFDVEVDGEFDVEGPTFWERTIRITWLVPIVVVSIAVGYLGSLGPMAGLQQPDPASEKNEPLSNNVDFTEGTVVLGDLQAADSWFAQPVTEDMTFRNNELLEYERIDPSDVRLAIFGGNEGSLWVARTDATLCLLITHTADSASTCVERETFERQGIALAANELEARWYGRDVITSPALVDPTQDQQQLNGRPGNVDAANAALRSQGTPQQNILTEAGAKSMGVDLVGGFVISPESAPWMTVLIAKQKSGGFCMIVSEDGGMTTLAKCATVEEFQTYGLGLALAHHVFQWDGTSTTVSRIP